MELGQDHQGVRLAVLEVHDARVVVNGGDVARLVGHARGLGQAGGNAPLEALVVQDLQHLRRGLRAVGLAFGERAQQLEQPGRSDLVVDAGLEGGLILDAPDHLHPVDAQLGEGGLDGGHAQHVDQQVRREVARGRDHRVRELLDGHGPAEVAVQVGIGVAVEVEHVELVVHDAAELVAHVHGGVEGQLAPAHLAIDAEEHGQLHGRGGMEVLVRVVGPLQRGLGVPEGDPQPLQAVPLADGQHARVEGDLRAGDGRSGLAHTSSKWVSRLKRR